MLPFLATAGGAMGAIAASDIDLDAFDLELDATEDTPELLWLSSSLKWQDFNLTTATVIMDKVHVSACPALAAFD